MKSVLGLILIFQGCAGLAAAPERVVLEAPDTPGVLSLAEGLFQAGEYDRARWVLLEAYNAGGREAALLMALSEAEIMLGFASDAVFRMERAVEAEPRSHQVLFWAAIAAKEAGRGEESSAYLKRALAAAGENEVKLYDLAEKFLRRGVPSVAAAIYEKILAVYPAESQFDVFSTLHLSSYYHLTGRNDRAAEVTARAKHAIEYADVSIMTTLEVDYWVGIFEGLAAVDEGDVSAGASRLRDAAASFPVGLVADGFVVAVLDRAGKAEEAEAVHALVTRRLKERIAAEPEKPGAYHDFAFFSAIAGRGAQTGLKHCQWALTLEPLRPEYLNTKAVLLFALGRYDDALKAQERAIALISTTRWAEPGLFLHAVWQRLDILEKTGRNVPRSFRRLVTSSTD